MSFWDPRNPAQGWRDIRGNWDRIANMIEMRNRHRRRARNLALIRNHNPQAYRVFNQIMREQYRQRWLTDPRHRWGIRYRQQLQDRRNRGMYAPGYGTNPYYGPGFE